MIWFSVVIHHKQMPSVKDPNLGLAIKAKAWKGASQECNLGVTFAFTRV
jgi:hypothetical protein